MLYWSSIIPSNDGSSSSASSAATFSDTDRAYGNTEVTHTRVAEITKSPCWPMGLAHFAVCSVGVRDTVVLNKELEKKRLHHQQQQQQLYQHDANVQALSKQPRLM